jgi:hypothetical protein
MPRRKGPSLLEALAIGVGAVALVGVGVAVIDSLSGGQIQQFTEGNIGDAINTLNQKHGHDWLRTALVRGAEVLAESLPGPWGPLLTILIEVEEAVHALPPNHPNRSGAAKHQAAVGKLAAQGRLHRVPAHA